MLCGRQSARAAPARSKSKKIPRQVHSHGGSGVSPTTKIGLDFRFRTLLRLQGKAQGKRGRDILVENMLASLRSTTVIYLLLLAGATRALKREDNANQIGREHRLARKEVDGLYGPLNRHRWAPLASVLNEHLHVPAVRTPANLSTISNDKITVGVDLNKGASITYLSKKGVSMPLPACMHTIVSACVRACMQRMLRAFSAYLSRSFRV